jgi:hypothetical protein
MQNVRAQVERWGMRATRHGKRGWALLYDERPIIRRREYRRFLEACRAAVAYLDAATG